MACIQSSYTKSIVELELKSALSVKNWFLRLVPKLSHFFRNFRDFFFFERIVYCYYMSKVRFDRNCLEFSLWIAFNWIVIFLAMSKCRIRIRDLELTLDFVTLVHLFGINCELITSSWLRINDLYKILEIMIGNIIFRFII